MLKRSRLEYRFEYGRAVGGICEQIVRRRSCGVVRCGTTGGAASVADMARAFGLSEDPRCYHQIGELRARELAVDVLSKNLAYHVEIMPREEARELASRFFELCCTPGCRFYSNRDFSSDAPNSWMPATDATFDSGVIVVGVDRSGCLWVEDED